MSATVGSIAVFFKLATKFLPAKPAIWLCVALLFTLVFPAVDRPSASANAAQAERPAQPGKSQEKEKTVGAAPSELAMPKPAPTSPRDLPVAFTKDTPTSLAELRAIEKHVKALVTRVSPAVVAVEVGLGSGSGVVISADGLVLTAGHVVGAPNREVRFTFPDGKTAGGKTVGVNRNSDTGLMKITDRGPWPHVDVGDLAQAHLGDWVLALGHPGGFDRQRSLVVRLGRIIRMASDAMQTDCTISPGDSGGPLFDMYGRVMGIHSYISESMAENFHIPVTRFFEGWSRLVNTPNRSAAAAPEWADVGLRGVDAAEGCRLNVIEENSPAAKAGLKVGDVVLKVNGREIKAAATFRRWLAETGPGETLTMEIKRGDETLSLPLKLKAQPPRN